MTVDDLIDEFRRRVVDTVVPYLWSDDEILLYLDKAQRDFIRGVGGVRDSRSDLTALTISAGEPVVEIDKRIVKIVSARSAEFGDIPIVGPRSEQAGMTPREGRLLALVAGEDDGALRAVHVPDRDYELSLVIDRLPLEAVRPGLPLEVREENHMDLVFGMMAQAYTKQDVETRDEARASKNEAMFAGIIREAYLEKRRRAGSSRAVAYGGI